MTTIVRDAANTERTITEIQVRDATNTPRDITEVWVRDSNNVSRQVFGGTPLSVTVDPEIAGGIAYGGGVVTTGTVVATPAGGTAPYTHAWTVISHSNASSPSVDSPTSATTTFTQTNVFDEDNAVFRDTVTDDQGATATADVSAFFQNVVPPFP